MPNPKKQPWSPKPRTVAGALAKSLGIALGQTPNISRHNPDPGYICTLVRYSGLRQADVAARLGLSERTLRRYQTACSRDWLPAPYVVQFALEMLAARQARSTEENRRRRATAASTN